MGASVNNQNIITTTQSKLYKTWTTKLSCKASKQQVITKLKAYWTEYEQHRLSVRANKQQVTKVEV